MTARAGLLIVAIALIGADTAAGATTRHVVPAGGLTTGDCTVTPCDLDYAAETVAEYFDTVRLAPGTYQRTNPVTLERGVTIEGAARGAARPLLTGTGPLIDAAEGGAEYAAVRDVRLESSDNIIRIVTNAARMTFERVSMHQTGYGAAFILDCREGYIMMRDVEAVTATSGYAGGIDVRDTCYVDISHSLFASTETALSIGAGQSPVQDGPELVGHAHVQVSNTIFVGGLNLHDGSETSTVEARVAYSRIASMPSEATDAGGNITAAPRFVDVAAGDYHQHPDSPTRNAGSLDFAASLIDVDGDVRPHGIAPDIGADEHPPVAPAAATGWATSVTTTGATLHGTVDPNRAPTSFRFEYGPGKPYAYATAPQSAGAGDDPVAVSAALGGLPEGSSVRYRIVATSDEGQAAGSDELVTLAKPDPPVTPTPAPTPASPVLGRVSPVLTLAVTPRRDRRAPHVFRVAGRVDPPGAEACSGRVTIRFKRGTRTISSRTLRVGANCRYTARFRFSRRLARRSTLRVLAAFQGNQLLLPRLAKAVVVRTR